MPRRLAIAISHAPGLRGMPSAGHCSSAATSASCARSSARPTSRVMRASAAISFGDSIFQTASIAALREFVRRFQGSMGSRRSKATFCWVTSVSTRNPTEPNHLELWNLWNFWNCRGLYFVPKLFEARGCGLHVGGEVLHLVDLAHFDDLVVGHRRALGPLDGFFLRLDLDHPVAADAFLRLGERTVGDLGLAAGDN